MKAVHARLKHEDARREMAAFDALPADLRDWLRTANTNWEATKLRRRLERARTAKAGRWGVTRLLAQYRAEDALPANLGAV